MEQNQDAKWGLSARGLSFLVGFCSVFGSKCLEGQRPHFLGIVVFGGAVSGRGWTWPARGGGQAAVTVRRRSSKPLGANCFL